MSPANGTRYRIAQAMRGYQILCPKHLKVPLEQKRWIWSVSSLALAQVIKGVVANMLVFASLLAFGRPFAMPYFACTCGFTGHSGNEIHLRGSQDQKSNFISFWGPWEATQTNLRILATVAFERTPPLIFQNAVAANWHAAADSAFDLFPYYSVC